MLVMAAACGGSPPPEPAAPAPAPAPAPPPPEPVEEPPPPEDPDPAPPPEAAPEIPKSSATIGGVSVSEIDAKTLVAEVQKLKWAPEKVEISGGTVGKYENIRFGIDNGKLTGYLELVRPAAERGSGGASMMAPKDQKAMKEASAGVFLDETADVLLIVMIEGKKADAQKFVDKLIKK
jgi:hypothetical protein